MANNFVGKGILWGLGSLTGTLTGIGTMTLPQSSELSIESQEDLTKDGDGNVAQVTKFDHTAKCTLEFVPSNTLTSLTVTAALSAIAMPGTTLALSDANFTPVTAAFIVDRVRFPRSNTKAMMCSIELTRYINNSLP